MRIHEQFPRIGKALAAPARLEVKLGLRANLGQFSLLVVVNAFVGAMVGIERSILPAFAEEDFKLAAHAAVLSCMVVVGMSEARGGFVDGRVAGAVGLGRVVVVGLASGTPVPFLLMWAPSWTWVLIASLLLGISQGLTWSTAV